jgi:hypothetical protein
MSDVSIDIESLGTEPGAVILSIGAVVVDIAAGTVSNLFSRNITVMSSLMAGLTTDPETIAWWADPARDNARGYLSGNQVSLTFALTGLTAWLENNDMTHIWAKPPKSDIGLLEAAYRACKLPIPWTHRQPLCVRSAIRWSGLDEKTIAFSGVEHVATDDAIHQAKILIAAKKVK